MRNAVMLSVLACAMLSAQEQPTPKTTIAIRPPTEMQVGKSFEHRPMWLDGLKCTHCSFKNLTFLYAGGEYDLRDVTFSGVIRFEWFGAAENTMYLRGKITSSTPVSMDEIRFSNPRTLSLQDAGNTKFMGKRESNVVVFPK